MESAHLARTTDNNKCRDAAAAGNWSRGKTFYISSLAAFDYASINWPGLYDWLRVYIYVYTDMLYELVR